jgi:hypothetical protein
VIDARGDKGDCQPEHLYRKLGGTLIKRGVVVLSLNLPDYKITRLPNSQRISMLKSEPLERKMARENDMAFF